MGYVGNQQAEGFVQRPTKQDLTGATGTSLTLSYAVSKEEDIDLYINNVKQEPTTAYTVADTAVTLTGSIVATDDIYVVYNSLALQTVVPPDGSVTSAKLASGAAASNLGTSVNLATIKDSTGTNTAMTIDSGGNVDMGANTVVQIITNTYDTQLNLTTSFQDTGLYATITPKYSNSKILVQWCIQYEVVDSAAGCHIYEHIFRDSTQLDPNSDGLRVLSGYNNTRSYHTTSWVDEPATTSAVTYKIQAKDGNGDAGEAHENGNPSIMILTEIRQ